MPSNREQPPNDRQPEEGTDLKHYFVHEWGPRSTVTFTEEELARGMPDLPEPRSYGPQPDQVAYPALVAEAIPYSEDTEFGTVFLADWFYRLRWYQDADAAERATADSRQAFESKVKSCQERADRKTLIDDLKNRFYSLDRQTAGLRERACAARAGFNELLTREEREALEDGEAFIASALNELEEKKADAEASATGIRDQLEARQRLLANAEQRLAACSEAETAVAERMGGCPLCGSPFEKDGTCRQEHDPESIRFAEDASVPYVGEAGDKKGILTYLLSGDGHLLAQTILRKERNGGWSVRRDDFRAGQFGYSQGYWTPTRSLNPIREGKRYEVMTAAEIASQQELEEQTDQFMRELSSFTRASHVRYELDPRGSIGWDYFQPDQDGVWTLRFEAGGREQVYQVETAPRPGWPSEVPEDAGRPHFFEVMPNGPARRTASADYWPVRLTGPNPDGFPKEVDRLIEGCADWQFSRREGQRPEDVPAPEEANRPDSPLPAPRQAKPEVPARTLSAAELAGTAERQLQESALWTGFAHGLSLPVGAQLKELESIASDLEAIRAGGNDGQGKALLQLSGRLGSAFGGIRSAVGKSVERMNGASKEFRSAFEKTAARCTDLVLEDYSESPRLRQAVLRSVGEALGQLVREDIAAARTLVDGSPDELREWLIIPVLSGEEQCEASA